MDQYGFQDQHHNLWGLVWNENAEPLVQKVWISRWWQYSIKTTCEAFLNAEACATAQVTHPWSWAWWLSLVRCRKQGSWIMWPLRSLKSLSTIGPRSRVQSRSNKPPEIMVVGRGHQEERRKEDENSPIHPAVMWGSGWRMIPWAQGKPAE